MGTWFGVVERSGPRAGKRPKIPNPPLVPEPTSTTEPALSARSPGTGLEDSILNDPELRKLFIQTTEESIEDFIEESIEDAVTKAYLITVAREPTPGELEDSVRFVREQIESYRGKEPSERLELALTTFCQVLMSLNEFIYVE